MFDSDFQRSRIKSENENLRDILSKMREEKEKKSVDEKLKLQLAKDLLFMHNNSPLSYRLNN